MRPLIWQDFRMVNSNRESEETGKAAPTKKKAAAVLEVTLFLACLMATAHLALPVIKKCCGPVVGRFFIAFLWIVPPVLYVHLFRKDKAVYGFDLARKWRSAVHFGFWGFVVMIIQAPGFVAWGVLGMPGLLILYGLVIASIVVLFRALKNEPASPRPGWKIAVWLILLILPSAAAVASGRMSAGIVGWQAYYLFVVGFGEEIRSRGYVQSRLNEAFGRPWSLWGTRFGPGLILASILFGFSHIYQLGASRPNVLIGLGAMLGGLFYGIVRERAGTFLASALVHGLNAAVFEIYQHIFKM
jgi:membrane protease YdiL (CAAX protease family)